MKKILFFILFFSPIFIFAQEGDRWLVLYQAFRGSELWPVEKEVFIELSKDYTFTLTQYNWTPFPKDKSVTDSLKVVYKGSYRFVPDSILLTFLPERWVNRRNHGNDTERIEAAVVERKELPAALIVRDGLVLTIPVRYQFKRVEFAYADWIDKYFTGDYLKQ